MPSQGNRRVNVEGFSMLDAGCPRRIQIAILMINHDTFVVVVTAAATTTAAAAAAAAASPAAVVVDWVATVVCAALLSTCFFPMLCSLFIGLC